MRNARGHFKARQPTPAYERSTRTHSPVWSRRQDNRQDDRQANPCFDFFVQVGYHSLELIPNTIRTT
jgi:hypothetical protein